MKQTFGDFVEEGDSLEYLILSFSSDALPLQDRWRNNSLSAEFLAEYWGTFFLVQDDSAPNFHAEVKDAVNYITNELLENAIKYNYEPANTSIKLGIYLFHDLLRLYLTNSINPQAVKSFQRYIQVLFTENPIELYIHQIEQNAREGDRIESHLGFLTMLNDYNARLAWKFEATQQEKEMNIVTTMVELDIIRPS
jgi:hypothetical protein